MDKVIYVVGGDAEQSGVFAAFEDVNEANAYADELINSDEGTEAGVFKIILNRKTPINEIFDTMMPLEEDEDE